MPSTRASKRKRPATAMNDVDGLEHEMELLSPGVALGGKEPRRKPNREQYNERRKIRKMLERHEEAPQGEENTERLRGSKAAAGEKVIAGSLIFGVDNSKDVLEGSNAIDDANVEGETNAQDDEIDDNADEEDHSEVEDGGTDGYKTPATKGAKQGKTKAISSGRSRKRSRIQRMKSFRSAKMAERHGQALSAHIRGKPALAIRRLKRLAKDVPSAPQIYSSLGMIYHDLFVESQQKEGLSMDNEEGDAQEDPDSRRVTFADEEDLDEEIDATEVQDTIEEERDIFHEQLEYAKKAYGSYHIAACLCKRDAALWERSGDAALDIATLHSNILTTPKLGQIVREFHRAEKQRWLEEAKNDFQSADGLNPPGAFLQIKLAQVMIDLGLLSDALTLLTDVKERKDFGASYEGWQLYADLMLRIGYECKLWNEGTQTNENYMFRRWLRKHSQTFDWEERRLQALVKALEAASGTNNCIALLNWMQDRALSKDKEQPNDNTVDNTNEDQVLLERSNVDELAAFDKTTLEMELAVDTLEAKERKQARDVLVLRQAAMSSDETDRLQSIYTNATETFPQEHTESRKFTASIRNVRLIASELMRSLLTLDLHVGARLVGDAVSSYLIDRMKARKPDPNQAPQDTSTTSYAMGRKSYDEDTNSDGNDVDDKLFSLSDEEDLELQPPSEMEKLEKGVLPPDVRFLYGLTLAKEGKLALASHCLKAIGEFPGESLEWLDVNLTKGGVLDDTEWIRHEFISKEPFGRSVALACLSDALDSESLTAILRLTGPIYHQHVARLQAIGLIDVALSKESAEPRFQLRRAILVKIMMTNLYQQLVVVDDGANVQTLTEALEYVSFALAAVWKPGQISLMTTTIVDLMSAFERTVRFCIKTCDEGLADRLDLTKALAKPIGLLCGVSDLRLDDQIVTESGQFNSFPIEGQWISRDLWPVALQSFNLCAATNVSQFSGWENEEFSLRLLRQNRYPSFFGITMEAGHVAGYLDESIQTQLINLWQIVDDKVTGANFNFKSKIESLRETEWYEKVRERHYTAAAKNPIVHEAEDKGLSSFLRFSQMCLETYDDAAAETKTLLNVALSIILPISQFVLNEVIWDIPIGRAASTNSSFKGWTSLRYPEVKVPPPSKRPGYRRSKRTEETPKNDDRHDLSLDRVFHWETDQNILANASNLPLSVLLTEWSEQSLPPTAESSKLMEELHARLKDMRSCYSVQSSSMVSLEIAELLIQMVSTGESHNPFLCLHHAALYASQAPKLGTGDQRFHKPLPSVYRCTELEAIAIIGRADCLRALHFYQEAAFLCSFVGDVVKARRSSESSWTNRWKVVGVMGYDLSVTIRDTINVIKSQSDAKLNVDDFQWKVTVVDSFESARNDAIELAGEDTAFLSATGSEVDVLPYFGGQYVETEIELLKTARDSPCFDQNVEAEVVSANEFEAIKTEAV